MAISTPAELATALKGDNRTVVGSLDPSNPAQYFAATDVGPDGTTHGLANASTATAAAYGVGGSEDVITITVAEGDGGLTKDDLRTQYFHQGTYDSTKVGFGAKRCFVNSKGQPLDANGTPTTVAAAVDADTTDLTALGEGVTNWAQVSKRDGERTPPPGTYTSSARASSLYVPHAGWTTPQVAYPVVP